MWCDFLEGNMESVRVRVGGQVRVGGVRGGRRADGDVAEEGEAGVGGEFVELVLAVLLSAQVGGWMAGSGRGVVGRGGEGAGQRRKARGRRKRGSGRRRVGNERSALDGVGEEWRRGRS